MISNKKIFILEDNLLVRQLIEATLKNQYTLAFAENIQIAKSTLFQFNPDLIILDIGLPDGDGFKLAAELRQAPQLKDIPIIFLTGKSEPSDKVLGFAVGADDYIVKPIEPLEFRARIENQFRKSRNHQQAQEIYTKGIFSVNVTQQKIYLLIDGKDVDLNLTTNEFKILQHFIRHEDHVLSRESILNKVWGHDIHISDRTVDTHIYAIRKKLGAHSICIQSIPRAGYRFTLQKNMIRKAS